MSTKLLEQADVKAATTAVGTHTIEFYAVAFSQGPDKQGDRVAPTAVDEWLARFYKAGKPLPISFTHAAIKETTDPFNIIGYAPANTDHVWKDEYGLRIRAYLETEINDKAEQVYRLAKRGIISGASVAYIAEEEHQVKDGPAEHRGSTVITKMSILEAGPCLDPANDDAYIVDVKDRDGTKAVDGSEWEANRAMSACSSASDYRSICAGEKTVGEPDERQHWALPHHYLGRGPNAAGVRNALSRLPQTQNLKNAGAARSHLEAHMGEINPEREASAERTITTTDGETIVTTTGTWASMETWLKAGRKISAANAAKLRAARDVIDELLQLVDEAQEASDAKANDDEPVEAKSDEPRTGWIREAIAAYGGTE